MRRKTSRSWKIYIPEDECLCWWWWLVLLLLLYVIGKPFQVEAHLQFFNRCFIMLFSFISHSFRIVFFLFYWNQPSVPLFEPHVSGALTSYNTPEYSIIIHRQWTAEQIERVFFFIPPFQCLDSFVGSYFFTIPFTCP